MSFSLASGRQCQWPSLVETSEHSSRGIWQGDQVTVWMPLRSDMLPLLLHQSSTTEPNAKTKVAVKIMKWYTESLCLLLCFFLPFFLLCWPQEGNVQDALACLPGLSPWPVFLASFWPSLSWLSMVFAVELLMVGWCGSGVNLCWLSPSCPPQLGSMCLWRIHRS